MSNHNLKNNEIWQHSVNHNEMILQSVGEGICVIDRKGNISFANLSAAKMLGWENQDLINQNYQDIFFQISKDNSNDDVSSMASPIEFTLAEGETFHINTETFYNKTGDNFLVEYISAPLIENGEIVGAVITFQDITERRDIEIAIAKARDAAIESARLKAGFLANMSHEIRTPLNGITGIIELLAETNLSDQQSHYVEIIKTNAANLLNIVNDILDFSKIEAKMLELEAIDFDLHQIILETVRLFTAEANKKKIYLGFKIIGNLQTKVRGDVGRLRQVLNNLVGNAVKFTEKGEVLIYLSQQSEDIWKFEVVDTGIGISSKSHSKIFESFSQADISTTRRFGGTGLGLAISKQLVEIMGGEIGVKSEIGKGSTFWFTAKFERQTETLDSSTKKQELSLSEKDCCSDLPEKLKILVVEDNEANKLITSQMLKNIGYEVDIASNGREAVEAVKTNKYGVILMDCFMPEMDGFEATKLIREQEKSESPTKIIALTASIISAERDKCLQAGMNDFLPKPFTKDDLTRVLNTHFEDSKTSQTLDYEINIGQHPLATLLDKNILEQFLEIESNGEKDFVNEMIDVYLNHSLEQFTKLQTALVSQEKSEIKRLTHTLRGSTGNIGFTSLYQEFITFENEIDKDDWAAAEKTITKIWEKIKQLQQKSSDLADIGEV